MTDSEEYKDLTYASAGISAISAITGAFTQANAARAQGDVESIISGINSRIASLQSAETIEAGDIAASREELKSQQVQGSILSSQGASGIDVGSGSSALVRNAARSVGTQDALTIRNNAQRQAFGFQTQALSETSKGQIAQLTAKAQADQDILNGGLSAIRGPLSIAANYLKWQRSERGNDGRLPFNEE